MDKVVFALNDLYLLQSGPSPLRSLRCYTQFPDVFLGSSTPMFHSHGDRVTKPAIA